jgi:hypothetical protein
LQGYQWNKILTPHTHSQKNKNLSQASLATFGRPYLRTQTTNTYPSPLIPLSTAKKAPKKRTIKLKKLIEEGKKV